MHDCSKKKFTDYKWIYKLKILFNKFESMLKIFKYLVLVVVSLYIIGTLSLKNHFIQDRLLDIAIKSIAIPESNLPEDDALTAIVCGSRAPINDPARAEACILVQAGQDIYIFDTGGGSIANLNNWNIPWDRVKTIFYTHLHSDHVFDIADTVTIDILDYHTPIMDVVKAANEANVKHLIFYHHLPAPRNQLMEDIMYRGVNKVTDEWTSSHDGTRVILPIGSTEILVDRIE